MDEISPIPTLLAFIVCDTVIHDAASQKKTLVGLFDQVLSPREPITINNLAVYAKLVEGSGDYAIKVRLVNLKDEGPVLQIEAKVNWTVAESPLELGMNFTGVVLNEFGTYEFQLFANDIYLGRAIMKASKFQVPPAGLARGN